MDGFFNIILYGLGAIAFIGCISNAITKANERRREKQKAKEARQESRYEVWDEGVVWPKNEDQAREVAERNTGIMIQIMRDLGCQPEITEEDPYTFHTTYQGEVFTFVCANPYIRIYDLGWSMVDVKDHEFPAITEAMNAVNFNGSPTVVMTDADENGHRVLHSHTSFLLHPAFSQNTEFIKGQLASFFSIKEEMRNIFHQLIDEQQEMAKKRKFVGFTTGSVSDN